MLSAAAVIRGGKILGFAADPAPKDPALAGFEAGQTDVLSWVEDGQECEYPIGSILYEDADDPDIAFSVTVGPEACGFRLQAEAAASAGAVIVVNCVSNSVVILVISRS